MEFLPGLMNGESPQVEMSDERSVSGAAPPVASRAFSMGDGR